MTQDPQKDPSYWEPDDDETPPGCNFSMLLAVAVFAGALLYLLTR